MDRRTRLTNRRRKPLQQICSISAPQAVSGKKRNAWLCEVEACKALGGFALVGKTNYPAEGCWRIDTMYGGGRGFDQHELEWSRLNQFVLLSEDGNAVSIDTTCEYEMNWNKSCKSSPDFEVVCERSG